MILFSVAQVAKLFDVHEATVLGWLRDGLPAFKKGRVIRINDEDLRRFVRFHTWGEEGGAKARYRSVSSRATELPTTTGERRSPAASNHRANDADSSARRARRRPPALGSATSSHGKIVAFQSKELA